MSRAININATHDHVTATCGKRNVRITAIEALASGGTRLVTSNALDSATIARAYGSKVIAGTVKRMLPGGTEIVRTQQNKRQLINVEPQSRAGRYLPISSSTGT
jgi:hypothetical protein